MSEFATIVTDVEEKSMKVMKDLSSLRYVQTQNVNLFSKTKEFVSVPSKELNRTSINAHSASQSEKCSADAHVKFLLSNFTNALLSLSAEHPTFLENFCHSFARFAALDNNEIRGICTKPEFKWLFNCEKKIRDRENKSRRNKANDSDDDDDARMSEEEQNSESAMNDDTINYSDTNTRRRNETYPDVLKKAVSLRTRWPRNRNNSHNDDDDDTVRTDIEDCDSDDDDDECKDDKIMIAPNLLRQIALQVAKGEVQRDIADVNGDENLYNTEFTSRQQRLQQQQEQQQHAEGMESRVATYLFRRWAKHIEEEKQ